MKWNVVWAALDTSEEDRRLAELTTAAKRKQTNRPLERRRPRRSFVAYFVRRRNNWSKPLPRKQTLSWSSNANTITLPPKYCVRKRKRSTWSSLIRRSTVRLLT